MKLRSVYKSLPRCNVLEKVLYVCYKLLSKHLSAHGLIDTNGQSISPRIPYFQHRTSFVEPKMIVSVTGFGHSGSGAVLDLLSEYEDVTTIGYADKESGRMQCQFEFDFMRRPWGLFDLERAFAKDAPYVLPDSCLKSFLQYIAYLHGMVGGVFNDDFIVATREFIGELVYAKYGANGPFGNYDGLSHMQVLGSAGARWVFGHDEARRICMLKNISIDEYRVIARRYLRKVIGMCLCAGNGGRCIVLDQATSDGTADIDKYIDFLGPHKEIAVWRDPRDVYATGRFLNEDWIPDVPHVFCEWYRRRVSKYVDLKHPDFMLLRFEDLVLRYDKIMAMIEDFLGVKSDAHRKMRKFFNPDVSCRNVGLYKRLDNKSAIETIERELPNFLDKRIVSTQFAEL